MGAGQALAQTVLPKWFIKRRGRVLGIAASALLGYAGFGGAVVGADGINNASQPPSVNHSSNLCCHFFCQFKSETCSES